MDFHSFDEKLQMSTGNCGSLIDIQQAVASAGHVPHAIHTYTRSMGVSQRAMRI